MKSRSAWLVILFSSMVFLVPALARAAVCIEVDTTRDALTAEEQTAARQVLEQVLIAAGKEIGGECEDRWKVSHVRLGASVQVLLVTGQGNHTAAASSLESLPQAYQQLVAGVFGTPPPATRAAAPVETETEAPRPAAEVRAPTATAEPFAGLRGAFYARLGYGVSPALSGRHASISGPTMGVGYRRWIGQLAFDLSVMNFMMWQRSEEFANANYDASFTSFVRLMVMHVTPTDSGAMYFGGGLSYGQATTAYVSSYSSDQLEGYTGQGVQLEGSAGYELLRNKAVRLMLQADLTLPLYQVEARVYVGSNGQTEHRTSYSPTASLSIALGF